METILINYRNKGDKDWEKRSFNAIIQGQIHIKIDMEKDVKDLNILFIKMGLKTRCYNFIHDSLIVQVQPDENDKVKEIVMKFNQSRKGVL